MTSNALQVDVASAPVGARVRFVEEKQAYTIQARGKRFLVCSKPLNAQKTVLYMIIDLKEMVRGPENLIFGMGAETREQCEQMLARLEGRSTDNPTEVSWRHRIPLRIERVVPPKKGTTVPTGRRNDSEEE